MTRTAAFVLIALLPRPAVAADASPKEVAARCDAYMQARVKYSASRFSGSVLLARDGQALYKAGFGLADREHDVPNTPRTKFRLASVSKQFVATAIMILEHEGRLKVDDPISKYVPSAPDAWGQVTLHQLMSHTGGVPENLTPALLKGMWPQPIDKERLLDHVKKAPLGFKPGEKWSYSNTGYVLLGLTIEKVSGMPYEQFLKERIFDPLGMKDTGVDHRRLVLKDRAIPYGMLRGEYVHAQYIDLSQVYAAGSMYSTVEDLLKWDNALYTDRVLPQSSLKRMWSPVKNDYGYGWLIVTRGGRKLITHGGGLPGVVTTVDRYPEQKLFVCVLCNLEGSVAGKVARDLAAIALGDPYDVPVERKEAKVDPKVLEALAGDYEVRPARRARLPLFGDTEFRPARVLKVTLSGDELYAQMTGQGRFRIRPESATSFFAPADEIVITFAKDDKGQVTGLTLHQNGVDVKAKRVGPKPESAKKDEGSGKGK